MLVKFFKNKILIFFPTVCLILIGFAILNATYINANDFTYVGAGVCRKCHGESAIGNQYAIWVSSPHAKAFYTLLTEKGMAIAKREGVADPANSRDCLKCHATGRGQFEEIKSEGVGCEACHGPGSEYHRASNHVDFNCRENGYKKAILLGMYPILGTESLKRRERLCYTCHSNNRPCFPQDLKDVQNQKLYIHTIDSLIKGDTNFRHPLRR